MDPQPALTCDMVINAARNELSSAGGVSSLEVRYGGFCPPNARCAPFADDLTNARVIVRMESGDDIQLVVSLTQDGSVDVVELGPLPGPSELPAG